MSYIRITIQLVCLTFSAVFIASCVGSAGNEKEIFPATIGLQPLDGFENDNLDAISNSLKNMYGCRVVKLENQSLPPYAFVNIKAPRYRADTLLRYLLKMKPDTIDFIMGLTTRDISTTKRDLNGHIKQPESKYLDWGIFGLGYKPGKSCIISSYRIKDNDHARFISRLEKVCVHEFGHNLGLSHCQDEKCVMRDAEETIKTIDSETMSLCIACKSKIRKHE